MVRYINVICWGNSNGAIFPSGEIISISCQHQNLGNINLTINAENVPVQSATEPFTGSPPSSPSPPYTTDYGSGQVRIPGDRLNGPTATLSPFSSTDTNNKACYRIKDLNNNYMYYADVADYDAKVGPQCNPVAAAPDPTCYAPANFRVTINGGLGIVTLGWTAAGGGVTYEISNSLTDAPSTPSVTSVGTHLFDGLSLNTVYYSYIRTVCLDGSYSSYIRVAYTTHS